MNIIDAARRYVGIHEGTPQHTSMIDRYNSKVAATHGCYRMSYTDPWCAAFVSLCAAEAGFQKFPYSAACQPMVTWAKESGLWGKTPSVGGLVLYDWDGDGIADHVGIVTAVDGYAFTSIEGNTSDMCAYRHYNNNAPGVMGFVRLPVVSAEPAPAGDPVSSVPTAEYPALSPVCRYGAVSLWVRAMQCMLIARGYGCGPDGADGEYGANTGVALRAMQRDAGITVDGVCGPETWKKLVM